MFCIAVSLTIYNSESSNIISRKEIQKHDTMKPTLSCHFERSASGLASVGSYRGFDIVRVLLSGKSHSALRISHFAAVTMQWLGPEALRSK